MTNTLSFSSIERYATAKRVWQVFDGPWPWLIYLPLLVMPWLSGWPNPIQLAATIAGVLAFLPLYLIGSRREGRALILSATAVLAIGFALYWAKCNWTVLAIYAASMFGRLRPFRSATIAIASITLSIVAFSLALHVPLVWWVFGVVFAPMVGMSQGFRTMIIDQECALRLAQDEVRKIAEVAERERMGRDLHDLLGRTLTLIAVKADLAQKLLAADPARSQAEIADIAAAARDGLSQVRSALSGTTAASLPLEVAEAMRALSVAGIEVAVEGDPAVLPASSGAVLAMVLREAVTNVIRHAEAGTCSIRLSGDARTVRLTVEDDGRGGPIVEGRGLTGMRARMEAAGGGLDLTGGEAGTRLDAWLSGALS